jgi:hypothetical protein
VLASGDKAKLQKPLQHKLASNHGESSGAAALLPEKHCSLFFISPHVFIGFLHYSICLKFQRINIITPLIEIIKTDSFNNSRTEQQ